MKTSAKKCTCGRVSDPLRLMIVKNTWLDKGDIAHFQFDCPQCLKENTVKIDWK